MRRTTPRRQLLAYWICVATAIGAGIALRAQAYDGVLLADDYDHYAMHAGIYPVPRGPFDMFDFVRADGHERQRLMDAGRLPWWSDPEIHLSVLRPLSSVLLYLDFELAGTEYAYFHVHSFAWWALLVLGVATLFQELLPLPVAALGTVLYVLEEAHGLPVAWTANRNALVAVCFGVWALWAHLRFRRDGAHAARFGSWVLLALAFAGGEHALAVLGYFAAFELLGARGRAAERVLALAPVAGLAVAYLALRVALGNGIAGSGFYISPFGDPLGFVHAVSRRLPLLLGDLTLGVAADWHYAGPPWLRDLLSLGWIPRSALTLSHLQTAQQVLGIACGLGLIVLSLRVRHVLPAYLADPARWLLPGALLALIPSCATLPMSRLLLVASIGVSAVVASLLWVALLILWKPAPWPRRLGAGLLLLTLIGVHGVAAARRTHADVGYYSARSHLERRWTLSADLDDTQIARQHVLVIAAHEWSSQWALPFVLYSAGRPLPLSCHLLSAGMVNAHVLVRTGERDLELYVIGPQPRGAFLDSVYRPAEDRFQVGDRVRLEDFEVEVMEVWQGQPRRIRFTFSEPLDPATHVLLYPQADGLMRVPLPEIGAPRQLPAPVLPRFLDR